MALGRLAREETGSELFPRSRERNLVARAAGNPLFEDVVSSHST